MKRNIVVPEMGESVNKGIIVEWLKKTGDAVREGEPLFELETDKASVVVPSTFAGTVEILVQKESEVMIGQTVATVDSKESDPASAGPAQPPAAAAPAATQPLPLSPVVRRIAAENNLEPGSMKGSGKGERITKADALAAAEQQFAPAVQPKTSAAEGAAEIPTRPARPGFSPGAPQTRVKMTLLRKRTAERLVQARQQSVHVTTYNEIDMSKVMEIRAHYNESFEKEHGIKIGYMSFFVKACCKALADHRELNAQVEGDEIVYNNVYNIGV